MDGDVTVEFIKLDHPESVASASQEGTVAVSGEPQGKRMGTIRLAYPDNRGSYAVIPVPIAVIANGDGPGVMLSGGMDSVAALHWAARHHRVAAAVSFDYGAKHNHREIPCAAVQCQLLGVRHEIIPLSFIDQLFTSDLLRSGGEIPEGHYADDTMRRTVVLGVNLPQQGFDRIGDQVCAASYAKALLSLTHWGP